MMSRGLCFLRDSRCHSLGSICSVFVSDANLMKADSLKTQSPTPTKECAPNKMNELDALQNALNKSLDAIRDELSIQELPELSSTAEAQHPLDDPSYLGSPRLFEARRLALGCLGQLRNLLQVPYEKVVEQSFAVYDSACLNIVVDTGIVDKLAESPTKLSVEELSNGLELHPIKVSTILRYLAAQGWFFEHEYNMFSLARPALELRRGCNGRIWTGTPGKPLVAISLSDMLTLPEFKFSTSAVKTAFQLSHKTELSLFDYLKCHPSELEQWSKSVRSLGTASQTALVTDYPWESFAASVFVDCGGGQGYLSILLARKLQDCVFVIQDLAEVIPIAEKNAQHDGADLLEQGRLIVEAHNFFQVQPRKADVYMFRYILHNWSNAECVTILKNTAQAAGPEARFLIVEATPQPSRFRTKEQNCRDSVSALDDFLGATEYQPLSPPPFVPLNFGANSKMHLALGVHMMGVFNASERYLEEWEEIISEAGLHILGVRPLRASISVIECSIASANEPIG
ncbi:S-adenosyl-L-methionine-dependent methyltransferase [Mycena vitilis]|nr:S-adenosyl-L-methionine-dependent methyltransferase [Mycena vitilis]